MNWETLSEQVSLSKQLRDARIAAATWRVVSITLFVLLVLSVAACERPKFHWLDSVPKQSGDQ